MDQDQAIALLDSIVSKASLTRQEHVEVGLALDVLREVNNRFRKMVIEQGINKTTALKKKINPDLPATPPSANSGVDNEDRSQA